MARFCLVAVPLNYLPWRQAFLTAPVLKLFGTMTPQISDTERVALDAGTVGFEGELFTGQPNWKKLIDKPLPELSLEEQAFIDGPCEELCGMIDEWEFTHYRVDLSEKAWEHIKKNKFLGMIIPKEYGGLGFSAIAHRAVLEKVGGMSATVGSVVAVPNSLGPAELAAALRHRAAEKSLSAQTRLRRGNPLFRPDLDHGRLRCHLDFRLRRDLQG